MAELVFFEFAGRVIVRLASLLRRFHVTGAPTTFEIARATAMLAYNSWAVVDKDDSAAHAWWLFCSLLRLNDSEIEPLPGGKYRLRGTSGGGTVFEATGASIHGAFEKALK